MENGNGVYAFSSLPETGELSETEEGIYIEFVYGDCNTTDQPSELTPPTPAATTFNNTSHASKSLRRTAAQQWITDSETGELRIMTQSDSWPSVKTSANSGPSSQSNEDEIFEREYQAFMRNRDLANRLIALEELNEDEEDESSPVNTPSPVPKPKPLGPEGTELIDETFRPLPGECGVYPQRWVTHQSTRLQSQPTELSIS